MTSAPMSAIAQPVSEKEPYEVFRNSFAKLLSEILSVEVQSSPNFSNSGVTTLEFVTMLAGDMVTLVSITEKDEADINAAVGEREREEIVPQADGTSEGAGRWYVVRLYSYFSHDNTINLSGETAAKIEDSIRGCALQAFAGDDMLFEFHLMNVGISNHPPKIRQ